MSLAFDPLTPRNEITYLHLWNIGFTYKEQGISDNALVYLKQARNAFESIGEVQAAKISSNVIDEIEKENKSGSAPY